jgi:hypothetical protein
MKTKRFDCVDMMHCGAKRIYRATKDLSRNQELEYWRQKAGQLLPGQTKRANTHAAARGGRKVT